MRVLLDTHVWLWSLTQPERLNDEATRVIVDPSNDIFLSVVSAWEIAIKSALGLLPLPEPASEYVPRRLNSQRISALPIQLSHALRVEALPPLHKDPFDRLLVAQAQLEDLTLLTADEKVTRYDVRSLNARR